MGYQIATLALGPVLLLQGRMVRRRIPRLSEPPGAREGASGDGPLLRLLIVGDSAAAGVGASHQDQALLGQVVGRLGETYRVAWTLRAATGATTASTLASLRDCSPTKYDVAVTSLGVNDITRGVPRTQWRRRQGALRSLLKERFGVERIIVSGLPPMSRFPALPQPLRWYLGVRARQFTRDLRDAVDLTAGCGFVDLGFTADAALMASDGFHPGPGIYAIWGQRVAECVRESHGIRDGSA